MTFVHYNFVLKKHHEPTKGCLKAYHAKLLPKAAALEPLCCVQKNMVSLSSMDHWTLFFAESCNVSSAAAFGKKLVCYDIYHCVFVSKKYHPQIFICHI